MNFKYKLAIFDLDGTILNTIDDLADAVNVALSKNGMPTRTVAEVTSFVGNGIKRLIERAVPDGTEGEAIARVHADFTAHYTLHCADKTAPYAGVPELLQQLRASGVRTAVLSNKAHYAVRSLCATYFPTCFDAVAGEREAQGIPKKPAPDAVLAIMRELGVTAEQTVYIGDSDVDIETARNAGIPAILVSFGFRSAAFLRAHGAETVVDTPQEIADLILQP